MRDQAIITAPRREPIADGFADFLRQSFPERCRAERKNTDSELTSITIDRRELRKKILSSQTFRRSFRQLPLEVQDLYVKRGWLFWGQGGLGECMSARVYVSDTKALGHSRGTLLGKSLSNSIRGLQEKLESLAVWAQAAVIVGTIGAILGTLGLLAREAYKVISSYSDSLEAAATSEEGLERAIRARSGRTNPQRPPAESQPNQRQTSAAQEPTSGEQESPLPRPPGR